MSEPNAIPQYTPSALAWLDRNWPLAGTVVAVLLIARLPLVATAWSLALVVVYAVLIVYLIHQIEEHYGDRFRLFVNHQIAGGAGAPTPRAVMWVNVGAVWALYLLVLLLAGLVDIGLGLMAVYVTLLNAAGHVGMALAFRRYTPGLWTALVLRFPVGIWAWVEVGKANGLSIAAHIVRLVVAVLSHAVIIAIVRRRTPPTNANPSP